MRPVNLLPERYRPARATGRLRGSAYVAVGALGVVLLMILGYIVTQNQINSTREDTNEAVAQAQVAEARASELGAFGNFLQVKQQREAAVKQLALTRFDYERVMRELALALPDDVFLTQLSSAAAGETSTGATGPQITLGGCAPDHPSVADTLVRLRKLHKVADVVLNSSIRTGVTEGGAEATAGGGCRVTWTALASFNPEAAPEQRPPVPARLGGGA